MTYSRLLPRLVICALNLLLLNNVFPLVLSYVARLCVQCRGPQGLLPRAFVTPDTEYTLSFTFEISCVPDKSCGNTRALYMRFVPPDFVS
jgi:hypothetical protein